MIFFPKYAQYIRLDSIFSRSPIIRFPGSIPPSIPIEPHIHILKSLEWFDCIVSLHSVQCTAFLTCVYSTPPYLMVTILFRLHYNLSNRLQYIYCIEMHMFTSLFFLSFFLFVVLSLYLLCCSKKTPVFYAQIAAGCGMFVTSKIGRRVLGLE